MKIALYQMHIIWEDKEKNIEKLQKKLGELKNEEIDLLLLPEMSFTGFSMNTEKTKENNWETVRKIQKLSKNYKIAIGFGWVKKYEEKAENHYTIVNSKGEILSDYVKIHPFSYSGEHEKFVGGSDITFFNMNNIVFSNFICYDLRFPEIFQIASKKADIIIVPANWPAKRTEHWKCLLRARAIENQVYILAINCVGNIDGIYYSGNSCMINPNGEIIRSISDCENIIIQEIDGEVKHFREEFPVKKDRREDLYEILR